MVLAGSDLLPSITPSPTATAERAVPGSGPALADDLSAAANQRHLGRHDRHE
jgi:hypothetical protein